jgi:hypothetical protein
MGDMQVRRLPVMDRLAGIATVADAVLTYSPDSAGTTPSGICLPGGLHASAR